MARAMSVDGQRTDLCEICFAALRPMALRGGGQLDQCVNCGHLHRDLRAAPAAHRELAYGGDPRLDAARLGLTFAALRSRHGQAPGRVFEIGYGTGALLRRFADAGAQVAGCDPDQLAVDVDPQVQADGMLVRGGIESVQPEQLGFFDLVFGVHVLEHVRDPRAALTAAAGLLAPGGTLVIMTPAGDSSLLRAFGARWWMLEDPTHIRFFTRTSLARAVSELGLTEVTVTRPLLDSLSVEAATLARALSPRPRVRGVLTMPGLIPAALVGLPLSVTARLVAPSIRPTLMLCARRAA